jgi:hypothetical protein
MARSRTADGADGQAVDVAAVEPPPTQHRSTKLVRRLIGSRARLITPSPGGPTRDRLHERVVAKAQARHEAP